jgi:site-specific DNA recombinase
VRENGTMRAVLYARVSTEEQTKGYSLRQQVEACRAWCSTEGYEVVEEVEDGGFSGMFLDRPGLDRARDLIEAGEAAVVVAQDADRITRKAAHRLTLDEEAERHGARWIALDDWGDDSHEGQLLRFMRGWQAEGESLKLRERSRRGYRRKVTEGKILGSSPWPRYGFAFDGDRTAYVVDPETMPVVVRILGMLAEGHAINVVGRTLDAEGVPTPKNGAGWSRKTIRDMALDDLYRPHAVSELEGQIPAPVLAALDPERAYGIAWSGRLRVRKVSNAKREREATDPSEWIGVPVDLTGSGLVRETADEARRVMQNNRRSRPVGDRIFPLAHGPLTCAHCGCNMQGFGRRHAKNPSYAYRCVSPSRKGTDCPNRRQHHADALEYAAVSLFETYASSGKLVELYEAAIVEQDRQSGRSAQSGLAKRRDTLKQQLKELEDERLGYLRQNARGVLSDAELDLMLAELNELRGSISAQLRRAEDAAELERERAAVREALTGAATYDPVHAEWYEDPDAVQPREYLSLVAGPEEIRRAYIKTGARFAVDVHGTLTLELDPLQTGRTHMGMSCGSSTRTA